jgi:hypothetical protein
MKKSHSAETMLYLFIECAAVRRRAYQPVYSHSKLKTQEDAVKDQTWPAYLLKSAFVSAAVKLHYLYLPPNIHLPYTGPLLM